jgi:hypothetical protein
MYIHILFTSILGYVQGGTRTVLGSITLEHLNRNDLTLTGQSVLRVQLASTLFLKNSFHWRVILVRRHIAERRIVSPLYVLLQ